MVGIVPSLLSKRAITTAALVSALTAGLGSPMTTSVLGMAEGRCLVAHVADMLPTHNKVIQIWPTGQCPYATIISCLAVPVHFYVGKWQHFIVMQKYKLFTIKINFC